MKPADYLDLTHTAHAELFIDEEPVWSALSRIHAYLSRVLKPRILGQVAPTAFIGEQVFIDEGTVVEPNAVIKGPAWIGKNCQVRAGCYIRENVIVGDGAVLGNSCEFKNCVIFDHCEVPHFNYVGDSILGYKAHLGAGVVLSNFKSLGRNVTVMVDGVPLDTGLRKFGALLGDGCDIGCNAVLNPGSIIGRGAVVYPNVNWRGHLPSNNIAKNKAAMEVVVKRLRET